MTKPPLVESRQNLSIIATSLALLDAEERGVDALVALLGVAPPGAWPSQFNGPDARANIRALLSIYPDEPGYGSWYIVANGRLTGVCGYKGPPIESGEVEIGYSIVPAYQRKGLATGAVRLLAARAFRDPRVAAVAAETLPSLIASQTVLIRNGFSLVSRRADDDLGEILRFALRRPE
jgi:ribosomal-protein-alanine N-acetyltransferase